MKSRSATADAVRMLGDLHTSGRWPPRPPRRGRVPRSGGFVLIYVSVLIVALLGLASLAVDWGRRQLVKTELQRSADAAALAAVPKLGDAAALYCEATSLAASNLADGTPVTLNGAADVEIGVWNAVSRAFSVASDPNAPANNAVRVTARRTQARGNALELPFGAMVGKPRIDVSAVSIATMGSKSFSFPTGFDAASDVSFNGVAALFGTALRLTSTVGSKAGSVWYTPRVPIQKFTTTFDFLLTSAAADGFTFCVQARGTTAMGASAQSLGFYSTSLRPSVAVKFDFYNNGGGETNSCTGIYFNGAQPVGAGSFDMLPAVNLRGGHTMRARFDYDGATLTQVVTDLTTNGSYTRSYAVDIPATLGTTNAWVGFTAATGGSTAIQDIKNWTFSSPGNAQLGR